jgi:hypothetical protein
MRKTCPEINIWHFGDTTLKLLKSTLAIAGLAVALLLTLSACTKSGDAPVADNPALAEPVPAGMVRGPVLETMSSAGYTYVLIGTEQVQRWLAAPETTVQVGDVIQAHEGMPMAQFESKTLNRTFDVVYFVDALYNLSTPGMPDGKASAAMPPGHPGTEASSAVPAAAVEVAELEPGQNIAYVYANKDTLAGQQVSLRGQVVKYNEGILGWNFIHVQDGSGDTADGSNDLTVTSKATTAVGETVVLNGTIILDKDFGAGYSFPVLMEDASLTAE